VSDSWRCRAEYMLTQMPHEQSTFSPFPSLRSSSRCTRSGRWTTSRGVPPVSVSRHPH
jgi:hypothetical protein